MTDKYHLNGNYKHIIFNVICVVIFFCSCTFPCVAALPKAAKLVPAETIFLVSTSDFSQLEQQFKKTNLYQFYKEPAMAAFVDNFKSKWNEQNKDAGVVKEILNAGIFPQKNMTFALVLNQAAIEKDEPTALFIIEWGQDFPKVKEAIAKAVKKTVENGGGQKTENYRSVEIKTIIAKDSSRLEYGFSSSLSYCFIDDCLLGSEDIEILKFVIAHIKGASSLVLADADDYKAVMKAVGPYHDIDFYVNIKQLIKMMLDEDSSGEGKTIVSNLGFDNVAAFGASVGVARKSGTSFSGKALLKINGSKKGVCKILDMESASVRPPAFISPDTYSMAFFNLDLKKAFGELGNILNSFSPAAAAWMYMPLPTSDSPDEAGLKIIDDIINHLGSQIIISQELNKPFTENSLGKKIVFCLEVNDRRALEKSLSLLHRKFIAPGNPDARRELLGYTIYRIDFPGLSLLAGGLSPMQNTSPQNTPQMPKLAFTITDTHLIFSTESKVEQTIRILNSPAAKSVASAKWFSQAKSSIPSIVGLAYMEDGVSAGELAFWMFKQHSEMQMIGMLDSFEELVDFSLLPDFEKVRKYFSASAFYGISRADGFFFEFKDLN